MIHYQSQFLSREGQNSELEVLYHIVPFSFVAWPRGIGSRPCLYLYHKLASLSHRDPD